MKNKSKGGMVLTVTAVVLSVLAVVCTFVLPMFVDYPFFTFHKLIYTALSLAMWGPLVWLMWRAVRAEQKGASKTKITVTVAAGLTVLCLLLPVAIEVSGKVDNADPHIPTPPRWMIAMQLRVRYGEITEEQKQAEEGRLPGGSSLQEVSNLCAANLEQVSQAEEEIMLSQVPLRLSHEYRVLKVQKQIMAEDLRAGRLEPTTAYAMVTLREAEMEEAGEKHPNTFWEIYVAWEYAYMEWVILLFLFLPLTVAVWLTAAVFAVLARRRKTNIE